jgi:hypothetical protein
MLGCILYGVALQAFHSLPLATQVEFGGWGYSVMLPAGVKAEKTAAVDFNITRFTQEGGGALMSLYTGLHPNFGASAPSPARRTRRRINGLQNERLAWRDDEGRQCSEVLITLQQSRNSTFSAHFDYCLASDSDVTAAEFIISSIRYR